PAPERNEPAGEYPAFGQSTPQAGELSDPGALQGPSLPERPARHGAVQRPQLSDLTSGPGSATGQDLEVVLPPPGDHPQQALVGGEEAPGLAAQHGSPRFRSVHG